MRCRSPVPCYLPVLLIVPSTPRIILTILNPLRRITPSMGINPISNPPVQPPTPPMLDIIRRRFLAQRKAAIQFTLRTGQEHELKTLGDRVARPLAVFDVRSALVGPQVLDVEDVAGAGVAPVLALVFGDAVREVVRVDIFVE